MATTWIRSTTREQETSNIENVLQHHRQMHDELTGDLSRMAAQLKLNSQSFGDTLAKDDKVSNDMTGYSLNALLTGPLGITRCSTSCCQQLGSATQGEKEIG